MGTVVDLNSKKKKKKNPSYCSIHKQDSEFEYIYIQFPEEMGSKFTVFKGESDLSEVDIDSLLFQLNGIFMEECNDFERISTIAGSMTMHLKFREHNFKTKVYTKDGLFIDIIRDFLLDSVDEYVELISKFRQSNPILQ